MAKPPAGPPQPRIKAKPAAGQGAVQGGAGAGPRKVPQRAAARRKGGIGQGLAARAWGGGPSWLAVAVLVLAALVLLPIAAAVLGDVWAMLLGALAGGFALGRATTR